MANLADEGELRGLRKVTGIGQTEVWSVHRLRGRAREVERRLTRMLDSLAAGWPDPELCATRSRWEGVSAGPSLDGRLLPSWAKGARVRRAGLLQHVVELTSWRGH